jgi:cytochrome c553
MRFPLRSVSILFLTLAACDDDTNESPVSVGQAGTAGSAGVAGAAGQAGAPTAAPGDYFSKLASARLGAEGNQATCATCHSNDGTQNPYSGYTMKNIAYHTAFKGPTLLDAVNACVTGWMGGPALSEGDAEWGALRGYLQSISDPTATAPNVLSPEVLGDEAAYDASYAGGDAAAGRAKYEAHCGSCHDGGLVVGATPSPPRAALAGYSAGRIAQQVRTSGPPPSDAAGGADTTPGPMPFFEPGDLPAGDLRDIVAFLKAP